MWNYSMFYQATKLQQQSSSIWSGDSFCHNSLTACLGRLPASEMKALVQHWNDIGSNTANKPYEPFLFTFFWWMVEKAAKVRKIPGHLWDIRAW